MRQALQRQLLPSFALLMALVLAPSQASAQHAGAEGEGAPAGLPAKVNLGDSAVELAGPWRFHTGDDMAWARPEFNDSGWDLMDLTPPEGTADPDLGTSDPIPGWSERGYKGYAGYAWYRLRVNVSGAHTRLALRMPDSVDDAYQVYVNGEMIGQLGHFGARGVTPYTTVPQSFLLPAAVRDGTVTIALRLWMDSATVFNSPDAGGLHGLPVLGHASAILTQVQSNWFGVTHDLGTGILEELILLLALGVSLTHYANERSDRAYLYLALVSLATLLGITTTLLANFTTLISQNEFIVIVDVLAAPLRIGLWVLFWASWFGLGPSLRFQRLVWGLVGFLALGTLLVRPPLYGPVVPIAAGQLILPMLLTAKLALAALLLWKSYQGIRRRRMESWLALPAIVLAIAANYQREAALIHLPTSFAVLGFTVSMGSLSTILSLLLVTGMLSRRFLYAQRRSVQWGLEVQQAREIQQMLVPRALPRIAGLLIESEYRPAREVGGDFFQIIPDEDDSTLIVFGDVTGKGLCAGMLVALIVGVIQTAAKDNPNPAALLRILNERLCERAHATATCLAMRITVRGEVTIASAGQLPPYLNGHELEMEGAFPLGIAPGQEFPIMRFKLRDRDRLVLISDGVAEAQSADGTLFGFDRVGEMLREPISAATLASAAQKFGQEDDILVLRVERRKGSSVAPHHESTLVFS